LFLAVMIVLAVVIVWWSIPESPPPRSALIVSRGAQGDFECQGKFGPPQVSDACRDWAELTLVLHPKASSAWIWERPDGECRAALMAAPGQHLATDVIPCLSPEDYRSAPPTVAP
jgi:hypothetical protein